MGLIKYLSAFFMIAIFSLAIINYMVGFGNDNGAVVKLSDDPEFTNYTSYGEGKLGYEFHLQSNSTSKSYQDSEIDIASETTRTGETFKGSGSGFSDTFDTFKGLMRVANNKIFGGSGSEFGWIITAFIALLLFIFILLSWKAWKGGNPE